MSDQPTIATDSALSKSEQRILGVILNQIIPADRSRNKPSATDVDVLGYIVEHDHTYLPRLREEIGQIQTVSLELHNLAFIDLEEDAQTALINSLRSENPRFLGGLAMNTATSYYQDDRVLNAIGMEARPPFPEGYEVDRGDLSLLEPVKARGKIYRDAPD